jgi:hypothetical protein
MQKLARVFLLLALAGFCNVLNAQTLKQNNLIISSQVTGHIAKRYNIAAEYFVAHKKNNVNHLLSVGLGIAATKTTAVTQSINGFDVTAEINLYGPIFMRPKWHEYGGLKIMAGQLNNKTANTKPTFYFIGVGTGIQPIIAKRIALKASVDIGYVRNGLVNTLFYVNSNNVFYSGIALLANVGVGIKL